MVRATFLGLGALAVGGTVAAAPCNLTVLEETAEKFLYMMGTGDHSWFDNLSYDLVYKENDKNASILFSTASMGLYISANRTSYDVAQCKIFHDYVVVNPEHPYIFNTQIYVINDIVETIDTIFANAGDLNFNATAYQQYAYQEKWGPVPEAKRDSREVLKAASDAYLDYLGGKSVKIPTAATCSRLQGGLYSADSCLSASAPPNSTLTNRRYHIDETTGTVNVFLGHQGLDRTKPTGLAPASHTFKIEEGKIRYIHEISSCFTAGCGLNMTAHP